MDFRSRQATILFAACWFFPSVAAEPEPVCDAAAVQIVVAASAEELRGIFRIAVPPPSVVLHRTSAQMRIAGGLPVTATSEGFYDSANKSINLACDAHDFAEIVRHETAHHYIRQAFGEIPSWLDEGMASLMETAPAVNVGRLLEFQNLLRRGQVPKLAVLLHDRRQVHLASPYYAVGWAFVYVMLYDERTEIQARRRDVLRKMLSGDPYREFQTLMAEEGVSLDDWERSWIRKFWAMKVSP